MRRGKVTPPVRLHDVYSCRDSCRISPPCPAFFGVGVAHFDADHVLLPQYLTSCSSRPKTGSRSERWTAIPVYSVLHRSGFSLADSICSLLVFVEGHRGGSRFFPAEAAEWSPRGECARSATGLPPHHRASPAQWRGRPIGAKARRPSSSPADTAKGAGHCARALPCLPAALPGRFPHCGRVVRGQLSAHAADAAARSADALSLSRCSSNSSVPVTHLHTRRALTPRATRSTPPRPHPPPSFNLLLSYLSRSF